MLLQTKLTHYLKIKNKNIFNLLIVHRTKIKTSWLGPTNGWCWCWF